MTDAPGPHAGLDTAGASDSQDVWDTAAIRRGHLRVRTLVSVRWMVIVGEVLLLAAMGLGLSYHAPYVPCALVIAAGAVVNLATTFVWPRQKVLTDDEALVQLALDIAQTGTLIGLLGGTANPFAVVLIAPVTLAAATLPLRPLLILGSFAAGVAMLLTVVSLPYPSFALEPQLSLEYRVISGVALVAGIVLSAG